MRPRTCDCSLIVPTFNRRAVLEATLRQIVSLPDRHFEVIVIDNGSTDDTPALRRAFPVVRWIAPGANVGCAARNLGAAAARGDLLLMLDDDSWPLAGAIERAVGLFATQRELGAAGCRVRLANEDRHDAGGVPGIFFNCGGFVRREAFFQAGGFPIDYDYYAEEYFLAARLWQQGWRIAPYGDLEIRHARVRFNRDDHRMLRLLVRNNLALWSRFAPPKRRDALLAQTRERYRRVAEKENALAGYELGLREADTRRNRRRSPLSEAEFAGLFGLDAARDALRTWADNERVKRIAIWGRGKGCEQLIELAREDNIPIDAVIDSVAEGDRWFDVPLESAAAYQADRIDGVVIGSLSPGVAEDTAHDLRARFPELSVLSPAPWQFTAAGELSRRRARAG